MAQRHYGRYLCHEINFTSLQVQPVYHNRSSTDKVHDTNGEVELTMAALQVGEKAAGSSEGKWKYRTVREQ